MLIAYRLRLYFFIVANSARYVGQVTIGKDMVP